MCGEKDTWSFSSSPRTGSPPRVRGKVITYQLTPERSGITPACAGKRNSQHTTFTSERDHPRVCGEKTKIKKPFTINAGSPPRVRGKAGLVQIVGGLRGITPACAGKSEKPRHHWINCQGSPPRVRGKADPNGLRASVPRITPACAGKSDKI